MGPLKQIVGLVVLICALLVITAFFAVTAARGGKDLKTSPIKLVYEPLQRQALLDSVRLGQVVKLSGAVNLSFQSLIQSIEDYERTNGVKILFSEATHPPNVDIYVRRDDANSAAAFLGKLAGSADNGFSMDVVDSILNNRTNWIDGPARDFQLRDSEPSRLF